MGLLKSGMNETKDASHATSLVSRAVQAEYEWNTRLRTLLIRAMWSFSHLSVLLDLNRTCCR